MIGLIIALLGAVASTYLGWYVRVNSHGYYFAKMAHVLLFFLIIGLNPVLKMIRPTWVLRPGELITIFILLTLANSPRVVIGYWVPLVSSPIYQASGENNWLLEVTPHIPGWLIPHDLPAVTGFYEGYERGAAAGIPWDVWLAPIVGWLPMILAVHVTMLCLLVILRRQWVERERLIYPIMQLNLELTGEVEKGRRLPRILRNGSLWVGFTVPMIVSSIKGLSAYTPVVPEFTPMIPTGVFGPFVSFFTLGFFFLVQREVLFGLWVFAALNKLQLEVYDMTGWGTEQEAAISYWSYGVPSLVHQSMGAMIVLVLGGIWVGREHILNVLRKALTGCSEVRDDDEIISYRGTVIALILSVAVMLYWLAQVGVPVFGAAVFLFFTFVIYLTLTRLVAEGGVGVIYTPMVGPDAAISAIGAASYGMRGMVGLSFSRVFANDILNFAMPHMANGLRLSSQVVGSRRPLFWAMLLALLLGLGGTLWMFMHIAYAYGAINMSPRAFFWMPNHVFDYAIAVTEQGDPNWLGWFHTALGGTVMVLLLLARRFISWWPIHPVGFPISSTLEWISLNAFLAWAVKGPVLRYGGVRLYKQVRPFFLGLILGHFVSHAIWWVIDLFTGMIGNYLWP